MEGHARGGYVLSKKMQEQPTLWATGDEQPKTEYPGNLQYVQRWVVRPVADKVSFSFLSRSTNDWIMRTIDTERIVRYKIDPPM